MTDTELILQQIGLVYDGIKRLEERMDRLETRVTALEEKVDRLETRVTALEEKVDRLEIRVTALEEKVDLLGVRVTNVEKKLEQVDTNVIHVEFGLGQEIQKVYELALQNERHIRELLPLKEKVVNIERFVSDRIVKVENRQELLETVVTSHGREIGELRARLA